MNFLRRVASRFKNNQTNQSAGEATVNTLKSVVKSKFLLSFGLPILVGAIAIVAIFISVMSLFGYEVEMMQMVDNGGQSNSNYNSNVGVNLNYDFEEYYRLSQDAVQSEGNPSADLKDTKFGNVAAFNQHIQDMIKAAGYGTREGVIAAGMSLIGDYIKYTSEGNAHGIRPRYENEPLRQERDTIGIVDENYFASDCSGFAWWALYNGGFKTPCEDWTETINTWAINNGYNKSNIRSGQPGDFVMYRSGGAGHIVLIVGVADDGYWVAEEAAAGYGARIYKYYFDYLSSNGYFVIDMTDYYNNSNNLRS